MFHDEQIRNEQNDFTSKTTQIFNRVPELSANFPEPWLQSQECMICNKYRFTAIFFYRKQNLEFEKNLANFYHINLKTFKYRPYITAKFTNFEPIAMKKISTIIDNMEVNFQLLANEIMIDDLPAARKIYIINQLKVQKPQKFKDLNKEFEIYKEKLWPAMMLKEI